MYLEVRPARKLALWKLVLYILPVQCRMTSTVPLDDISFYWVTCYNSEASWQGPSADRRHALKQQQGTQRACSGS